MFTHKEIWRLFGPPLAFTVVEMSRHEGGVPKVTWVPDATWLLFTRPGDLSLQPFQAFFYISNGKRLSIPLQPLGSDSRALQVTSLFLSPHLPIEDPLPGSDHLVAEEHIPQDWEGAMAQAVSAFPLRQHPLAPQGEKAIRKQLETQTGCFVCTKLYCELFEGKGFPQSLLQTQGLLYMICGIIGAQYKSVENKRTSVHKKNGVILRVLIGGFQKRWHLSQPPKTWLLKISLFIY